MQIAQQFEKRRRKNTPVAAAMRFNDTMHSLSGTIENSVVSGLDSIVMHTSSTGDAFRKMGSSVVSALDQMILKILVIEPLMRSLQGAVSSSGIFGYLFGSGIGTAGNSMTGAAGEPRPALMAGRALL